MSMILKLSSMFLMAGIAASAVTAQANDVVHIKKRNSQAFAIDGSSGAANAQSIYLWNENANNANQQWIEIDRGNGYYSYQKQGTSHCIDGGSGGANRQDIYLWTCGANNQNQHWLKETTDSGFVKLIKRNATGFAIDGGSNGKNGQNVNLYDSSNSSHNLQWKIEKVGQDSTEVDECINVDSLEVFAEYLNASDACIRVAPGTYTLDTNNVGEGLLFPNSNVLQFTGTNNTYIFDDVTFEFDTEIFRQFGSESVNEFHVIGKNNHFLNLTMEDLGDTAPHDTAQGIVMDGSDNTVEGFTVTTRGSYPYGYGDIFGKGGPRVLNHKKHSGILIRGDSNTLKNTDLYMRSYGHGVFVQGGDDVLIEGVLVEGELSTVDAVLAEKGTGSDADNVDFLTVWGYKLDELTENYRFSLQEDGIRAYTTGGIYGTDENRSTGSITVKDSTVKFMRSGVTIGWAGGDKHVENVTALGTESGFWVGTGATVVNSRGDASVGPLFSEDVYRNSSTLELTLLDNEVTKIGNTPSLYLSGHNHNVTIKDGTSYFHPDIAFQVAGTRYAHRYLEGSGEEPAYIDADDITLDNQTPYPVILGKNSNNSSIQPCGTVTDYGSGNVTSNGSDCN